MEPEIAPGNRDWMTRLGVRFYRYRMILMRHWWIPLLTVSLGLAVEGWILWNKPETFRSVGQLMVRGNLKIAEANQYVEEASNFYNTQLELLKNPDIRKRAIQRVELAAPELSGQVAMQASVLPRSSIFEIVGTGTEPQYTQRFVDAVMDEFINFKRDQRRDTTDSTMVQINEERARLERDLKQNETDLQSFVEKNNMAFWEEQGKTAARFLSDLKTQQGTLMTELHRLQHLTSDQLLAQPVPAVPRATTPDDRSGSDGASDSGPIAADLNQQYLSANQSLIQKKAELAERSKVWRPKHPGLIEIKQDIERIERLIATIKSQNRDSSQARIAAINAELASLDQSIKNWDERVLEASRKDAEYQRLNNAVQRTQDLYEKLTLSIQNLDIGKGINQESLAISQRATPASKVPPGTLAHLGTGLLAGLALGIIILGLMDKADDRVSSSSEMIEHFSEPILGQIPNVDSSRTEMGLPLLQTEDERYMYAEAFRSLRSSLVFMPNQRELKTLIITSAIPSEGKSTIASNLAITMALAGARVLLVDADLRRGDLAALFDVDGRFGLSSILRGEVSWRSVAQQTKHQTLTLIPRGPVTNQSGELLLVPAMDQIMREFKENFDLTIFNTSPVLATDDSATLAPNFDGTLVVVRAGYTSSRLTHNALGALYQRQVNVLGMVLNCVDTEMPDYYYYRYPKYYAA